MVKSTAGIRRIAVPDPDLLPVREIFLQTQKLRGAARFDLLEPLLQISLIQSKIETDHLVRRSFHPAGVLPLGRFPLSRAKNSRRSVYMDNRNTALCRLHGGCLTFAK